MKMIDEYIKKENINKPLSDNEISKYFSTKVFLLHEEQ